MNTHALRGIRTSDPSNQAASHLRLRPHGHLDRQSSILVVCQVSILISYPRGQLYVVCQKPPIIQYPGGKLYVVCQKPIVIQYPGGKLYVVCQKPIVIQYPGGKLYVVCQKPLVIQNPGGKLYVVCQKPLVIQYSGIQVSLYVVCQKPLYHNPTYTDVRTKWQLDHILQIFSNFSAKYRASVISQSTVYCNPYTPFSS